MGGATEALEWATEDLEVLDLHLMASECLLMALEEVMVVELAHTPMVVQVLYMAYQDLGGRGDIMHKLQLTVGSLLLTVPNLQFLVLNLLLLTRLLHNHLRPMVQGLLMMQLLRPMHPLPTIFLRAMVVNPLRSNSSLKPSNNLEPSNNLQHRHPLLLGQCNLCKTMIFERID